jgi:hypothetical protein
MTAGKHQLSTHAQGFGTVHAGQHDISAAGIRQRPAPRAGVYPRIIKAMAARTANEKSASRRSCTCWLLCSGGLIGGPAELFGGALAGFLSHLKLRLHFLKIATAPGEILFDSAEGFAVLLQASLQPFLCLRSLIQSMLRMVQ